MSVNAQIELWPAARVAAAAPVQQSASGVCFAAFGETRFPAPDLERMTGAVPPAVAAALSRRAYYFVPLALAEGPDADVTSPQGTLVAPDYTVELGDRASCHRNVRFPASGRGTEAVFISTRLLQDRFGIAFEFFINVAHNFVEETGVPQSFADMAWSQARADVRGETSQDAWESRRRAVGRPGEEARVDERARNSYHEAAFSDALAIYMLSLAMDFDYYDLREREYPLLAAPALAERLRLAAALFPPAPGYDFQVLYRRRQP
jgi:hypothetical protein